jgi:D-arabinose 1-dehydrogenase-like Zn-dependent alcohol dehydrogenase
MLDCEHNITSDIELIDMQDINKAYDRVTSTMLNIDLY